MKDATLVVVAISHSAGGISADATSVDQSDIRPPRIRIIGPHWSAWRLWEQACAVPRPAHACSLFSWSGMNSAAFQ